MVNRWVKEYCSKQHQAVSTSMPQQLKWPSTKYQWYLLMLYKTNTGLADINLSHFYNKSAQRGKKSASFTST